MLRNGWNFRGDVAMELEKQALSAFPILHNNNSLIYQNTIFSADRIVDDSFADVIIILMIKKFNGGEIIDKNIYENFIVKLANFSNESLSDIGQDRVIQLYDEFNDLYNSHEEYNDLEIILNNL